MGCCESNKSTDNEVQISERPFRSSDFYDVNLESPDHIKGFDFEAMHTNKSTSATSRIDLAFLQVGFFNA